MSWGFARPLDLRAFKPGEWIVLGEQRYEARDGQRFHVPEGFITDLASIPALLRGLFDQNGASRQAAVLHDYLYCSQQTTKARADSLFLEAMEVCGEGAIRRHLMYAAVYSFGGFYWDSRDGLTAEDFSLS